MISVTLDSNIYVSALSYGGVPQRLLQMARAGQIRLDVSEVILEEMAGVLRDKFGWPESDIQEAQAEIARFANRVAPSQTLAVAVDPDDDRILECAAARGRISSSPEISIC